MKRNEENMERFLKSQLEKEAEETIAEVEADKSLRDVSVPENMDDELEKMIHDYDAGQEAYKKLSEKDKEALRLGRELQILQELDAEDNEEKDEKENAGKVVAYRKKKRRKVYVLVAVVVALVLGMGMTSIGGAPFLTDMWDNLVGDREVVKVNTEREDENTVSEETNSEEELYEKIKEAFGADIVGLNYRPAGTKILMSDIDESRKIVCILYQYQGEIIEYKIVLNYNNQAYGYDVEDELISEDSIEVSKVPVKVKTYRLPSSKEEYVAQFEYKDAFYTLNAAIPKEEFIKIVENLDFY